MCVEKQQQQQQHKNEDSREESREIDSHTEKRQRQDTDPPGTSGRSEWSRAPTWDGVEGRNTETRGRTGGRICGLS